MKKLIYKDKKNRVNFKKLEKKKFILKSILYNTNLPVTTRWNAVLIMTNLPKNSSKTHLVKRCILTGRNKIYTKNYKFSRLVLLRLIRSGYLSGMKKATW